MSNSLWFIIKNDKKRKKKCAIFRVSILHALILPFTYFWVVYKQKHETSTVEWASPIKNTIGSQMKWCQNKSGFYREIAKTYIYTNTLHRTHCTSEARKSRQAGRRAHDEAASVVAKKKDTHKKLPYHSHCIILYLHGSNEFP